jgi:hypothetical protein
MNKRMVGWWSYPVPEFQWMHISVGKGFNLNLAKMDCDVVVYEDAKLHGSFTNKGAVPIAYHIVDSTLSEEHYQSRRREARWADIILVDWDYLARFEDLGVPVKRFNYCVNDKLFFDRKLPKDIDVGCFHGKSLRRRTLNRKLAKIGERRKLKVVCGRYSYQEYAEMLHRSKIVVNINRVPVVRNHRVFDTMASRSCLLSESMHDVSGEEREAGIHYETFNDDLEDRIMALLAGRWKTIADAGYDLVREQHTWATRAKELREILCSSILS